VPYGEVISLWDVSDRHNPRRLEPPLNLSNTSAQSVVFAPNTPLLAVVGEDGRVQLWDITDPANPAPIDALAVAGGRPVTALAFSADGRLLAGTDSAGILTLWDSSRLIRFLDDPVARACAVAGRGLTPEEWQTYLPDDPYTDVCLQR
jgi:WD40 repeat protein